MKIHRTLESTGLLIMTILGTVICVIAALKGHPRLPLMITLTAALAVILFLSRYRNRREVKTLHAHGRRKRTHAA